MCTTTLCNLLDLCVKGGKAKGGKEKRDPFNFSDEEDEKGRSESAAPARPEVLAALRGLELHPFGTETDLPYLGLPNLRGDRHRDGNTNRIALAGAVWDRA